MTTSSQIEFVVTQPNPGPTEHSSLNNLFQIQRPILPTDGATMGGTTSATVSEICMQALEITAITTADHSPKIWERHVDDDFSVKQRIYLHELLHHINSLRPQTQFTKEEEKDSILPFLDTLVQWNPDKTISVKVYRKPTHTNQYLNYTSHHSTSAKQSIITALFDRRHLK